MIKFLPLLLPILYGLLIYLFSAWRTGRVLDQHSTPLTDREVQRELRHLARALDLPHVPVSIYEIEAVNGLAAPDGRIFLTRGFYNKFREGVVSAEELASVIAHELGHVALGHGRRRMIDFTGQNALYVSLVALVLRAVPLIGPLLAMGMARMVTATLAARLSRDNEYAADEWASALLIKAGIGTGPQKSLFGKLDRLSGGGAAGTPAWLLSHPRAAARIAAIEANESRWRVAAG